MKLKLVAASMSLLSLISYPVFAATIDTTTTPQANQSVKPNQTTQPTQNKLTSSQQKITKPHKKIKHHVKNKNHEQPVNRHEREASKGKEENDEMEQPEQHVFYSHEVLPITPLCSLSQTEIIMDSTTQNLGRALPNQCNPGWFNRFRFSGGANVDMGKWGNRNANIEGENYQRFSLNDLYLNISAEVNEWAKAFLSISYNDATSTGGSDSDRFGYSAVYRPRRLNLEQAYATFGNFDVSPFYIQLGKMFQDFSSYEIHAITRSMTQVLSEALETSGRIGFIVPMGFHGSIYAFDDPIRQIGKSSSKTNYGASLGFAQQLCDTFGWDVGVAWLYNMMGAQDIAHAVTNFTGGGYHSHTDAIAAFGDLNYGPFMIGARYTGATKRFNPNDLPEHGFADFTSPHHNVVSTNARGAKPWAAGVQAGYSFEAFGCRSNNIYIGYQTSRRAAGIGLPKYRWLGGYGVDLFGKNTLVGIEWDHDNHYNSANGGNGDSTNLISIRAGVQFG